MPDKHQTLKGFRDFLNEDARKRTWLMGKMRDVFERFGFEPLETPTLEYESLLLGKYGAEAEKLMYRFEDNGGRRVALRYDQTVPTARIVSQYQSKITFPYKRYQIQNVWRADKPQKGRFREFIQCDADIIGTNSPLADAEVMALYASIYLEIGISSIKLKVNDRAQLIQTIRDAGISESDIFMTIQVIDKLDKKSEEDVLDELTDKGVPRQKGTKLMGKLKTSAMPEQLRAIVQYAQSLGIPEEMFEYTPTLARGLDYYTATIFEGLIPEYPVGSVGGGGRYDNLIHDLVGVDMPAFGFGIGFDRTLEAADELGVIPNVKHNAQVYVTIFDKNSVADSLAIATKLRNSLVSTEIAVDPNKKLPAQLKYADKKRIPYVVIIGPEEAKDKKVKLKDMRTGKEDTLTLEQLVDTLNK